MANRKRFAGASGLASFLSRLALIGLSAIALQLQSPRVSGTGDPQIEQPVLAVIRGRPALGQPVSEPLVIRGLGFGDPGGSSGLEFAYGEETVSVGSTNDEAIERWTDNEISVRVPDEVDAGTLRVIAGGQPSAPVEFLVYEYESFDIPPQAGTNPYGLALAVAPDGRIWMNREFHLFLQGFGPRFATLSVPQAEGAGIFASMIPGDEATRISRIGEDVEVDSQGSEWFTDPQAEGAAIFASMIPGDEPTRISLTGEDVEADSQGSVWFTEGGAAYYPGRGSDYTVTCDVVNDPDCHYCKPGHPDSGTCKTAKWYNTSRVVKYKPENNQFSCFSSPVDNSMVQGVLVDEERGIVWYAEGGLAKDLDGNRAGNAITGITMGSTLSNCAFDPYSHQRDQLCANGSADNCHWRFPLSVENEARSPAHLALDQEGNIWFTELFGATIGRLNPDTGQIIELPLPPTINTDPDSPAALVGSGPWELDFDSNGNLWVTEYFDATILKIDPSLMGTEDCLHLDANDQNPCITEVYEGLNPAQDAYIHTLDIAPDGKIWFVLSKDEQTIGSKEINTAGQVGFIDPTHDSAAVLLPILRSQYTPDWPVNVVVDGIGEAAGVVVHPQSGDIYFMESSERQLGRLHLGPCPRNAHYQIGNGVGVAGEDGTVPNGDTLGDACDDDLDNDGIPNESDPYPGGDITYDDNNDGIWKGAGDDGPSWDANMNGKRDGVESICPLSVNPYGDDDGDGLKNTWEVCGWGTDPNAIDTDGDGLGDCVEAADVDGNGVVNFVGDLMDSARAILLPPTKFGRDGDFDIDGNNVLSLTGDLMTEARFAFVEGTCR